MASRKADTSQTSTVLTFSAVDEELVLQDVEDLPPGGLENLSLRIPLDEEEARVRLRAPARL
jgi:hypothetical protein